MVTPAFHGNLSCIAIQQILESLPVAVLSIETEDDTIVTFHMLLGVCIDNLKITMTSN